MTLGRSQNLLVVVARQELPGDCHTCLASWLPVSTLVSSLTPAKAQRLYQALTQRISPRTGKVLAVATQQSEALGTNEDFISRLLAGLSPAQLAELKRKLSE